ncbi:MAG: dTMP kinase [Pseudonocardiaceae bacterium]
MSPYWITVEGIEGVGKTYLARRLAQRLGQRCVLVEELTDLAGGNLPGRVIAALSSAGDAFLRTGHPLTETFALLALKVREYEHVQAAPGLDTGIVLEDRGIDTVALDHAAILAGEASLEQTHALAQRIYAAAARWRPLPDLTILLVDDLDACLDRFERRLGSALSAPDRALVGRVDQLYARQVAREPKRLLPVDRAGRTEGDVLDELYQVCVSRSCAGEQRCVM